jgi:DNA-binding transcriptional ArsR family regulator
MSDERLQTMLRFFKALADESRLRLVGVLAAGERTVEELAALLHLKAPTVSHHLSKLKEAGLVQMRPDGTARLYRLDATTLRLMNKDVLSASRMRSLADDLDMHAWERKVLKDFFEGDRLTEIPASRKKRAVILRWLANRFDPGKRYTERQVNDVLKRHHADTATLRRELIAAAHGLMRRDRGCYWRTDS